MGANLNLDLITPSRRRLAVEAFEQGDVLGFLSYARRGNTDWLDIVADNASALRKRSLYEAALLHAGTITPT
jgi:hypothetical protein